KIGVTATTGPAAVQINGQTLHSWAGIGLGEGTNEKLIANVMSSQDSSNRWKNADYLIIDEVSMLTATLLDKLDDVGKHIRNNHDVVFGGIKIIMCGDFFQLPPVFKPTCPNCGVVCANQNVNSTNLIRCSDIECDSIFNPQLNNKYAFESNTWHDLNFVIVNLTEVFRQNGDNHFINILKSIRIGIKTEYIINKMENCVGKTFPDDGIKAYDSCNSIRDKNHINRLYDLQAQDLLSLKLGAQVMLLYNLNVPGGLVNGLLGIIVGFDGLITSDTINVNDTNIPLPIVEFMGGQRADPRVLEFAKTYTEILDNKFSTITTTAQQPRIFLKRTDYKPYIRTSDYI
ncbi:PIF1-like helicase-domain-containing protein, partial [Jimgerdemannia flammicorona]